MGLGISRQDTPLVARPVVSRDALIPSHAIVPSESVPHKGLLNPTRAYHCFLNVVLQMLWHVDTFRQGIVTGDAHSHDGVESCLTCAIRGLYSWYQYSDETKVLPPDNVRTVLATLFAKTNQFAIGEMDDAAECLLAIFRAVHAESLRARGVSPPGSVAPKKPGSGAVPMLLDEGPPPPASSQLATANGSGHSRTGNDADALMIEATSSHHGHSAHPNGASALTNGQPSAPERPLMRQPSIGDFDDLPCNPLCPSHGTFGYQGFTWWRCTGCGATSFPSPFNSTTYNLYVGEVFQSIKDSKAAARPNWGQPAPTPTLTEILTFLSARDAATEHAKASAGAGVPNPHPEDEDHGMCPRGRHASSSAGVVGLRQHPVLHERLLLNLPRVFCVSLVWPAASATKDDILDTMHLLAEPLDLRQLFRMGWEAGMSDDSQNSNRESSNHSHSSDAQGGAGGAEDGRNALKENTNRCTTYRLRGLVLYYGAHYVCVVADDAPPATSSLGPVSAASAHLGGRHEATTPSRPRQWLLFDDARVLDVGEWSRMVGRVVESRYQPTILFFDQLQPQRHAVPSATPTPAYTSLPMPAPSSSALPGVRSIAGLSSGVPQATASQAETTTEATEASFGRGTARRNSGGQPPEWRHAESTSVQVHQQPRFDLTRSGADSRYANSASSSSGQGASALTEDRPEPPMPPELRVAAPAAQVAAWSDRDASRVTVTASMSEDNHEPAATSAPPVEQQPAKDNGSRLPSPFGSPNMLIISAAGGPAPPAVVGATRHYAGGIGRLGEALPVTQSMRLTTTEPPMPRQAGAPSTVGNPLRSQSQEMTRYIAPSYPSSVTPGVSMSAPSSMANLAAAAAPNGRTTAASAVTPSEPARQPAAEPRQPVQVSIVPTAPADGVTASTTAVRSNPMTRQRDTLISTKAEVGVDVEASHAGSRAERTPCQVPPLAAVRPVDGGNEVTVLVDGVALYNRLLRSGQGFDLEQELTLKRICGIDCFPVPDAGVGRSSTGLIMSRPNPAPIGLLRDPRGEPLERVPGFEHGNWLAAVNGIHVLFARDVDAVLTDAFAPLLEKALRCGGPDSGDAVPLTFSFRRVWNPLSQDEVPAPRRLPLPRQSDALVLRPPSARSVELAQLVRRPSSSSVDKRPAWK